MIFCRTACADSGGHHVTHDKSSLLKNTNTWLTRKACTYTTQGACPDEYSMDTHLWLLFVQTRGVFINSCLVETPLLSPLYVSKLDSTHVSHHTPLIHPIPVRNMFTQTNLRNTLWLKTHWQSIQVWIFYLMYIKIKYQFVYSVTVNSKLWLIKTRRQ